MKVYQKVEVEIYPFLSIESRSTPLHTNRITTGKEAGTHCGRHSRSEGFGRNEKNNCALPFALVIDEYAAFPE
jgi:hypothetical protein